MIGRRVVAAGLGAVALSPMHRARAATELPVVGFAGVASAEGFAHLVEAFREGLAGAGFADGVKCQVEYRWADGQFDHFESLARMLVDLPVSALAVSGGHRAALICKKLTRGIPIVFSGSGDAVQAGLVESYARPGGNVTGVDILTSALDMKRFELLLALLPEAKRIAVLVNPNQQQFGRVEEKAFEDAAMRAGRVLSIVRASGSEIESAFTSMSARAIEGLLITADPVFFALREKIVAMTTRSRIPTVYEFREFAMAGGLLSYGASLIDAYRQVGTLTGHVLAGAKPADMPVARLSIFDFVVNLKTAATLGLTFPPDLLVQATEVIE